MKIKLKLLSISMIIVYAINAFTLLAHSQDIVNETEINKAIDYMLDGLGQKIDMQPRINEVVKYGNPAVPLLIKKYKELEDRKCWQIISCLCKISSGSSLEFIRKILKEHRKRWSTSCAISNYPINKENEIIQILIDLVKDKIYTYDASERLKEIIVRNPKASGDLVAALKDDDNLWEYYYNLGEILAWVSGYSNTWVVWVPAGENPTTFRNKFWREWWNRNKEKEVFEWLLETIATDNSSRKAQGLQMMVFLNDKRAIPYFLNALDNNSESIRYWAVVGLKKLNNTAPESGYKWEDFKQEEVEIIKILKDKYKNFR